MKTFRFYKLLLIAGTICFLFVMSKCKKDPPDPPPPEEPTYTCTSNITDGCLDDWETVSTIDGDYINPLGGFLQTLNELSSVPPAAGGPGPATVDTVRDCVQGKYAAKMTSKNFHLMEGVDIFIPGYVGASVLDITGATIHLGKPYTQKPSRLQGYYKYAPVADDSAMIEITLSKYNSGTGKRDTLAHDKLIIKNTVSSYTPFDHTLTYFDNVSTPDTLVLIFSASGGIDFNDIQGCAGQIGSTMWLDDLKFVFP